MKKQTVIVSVLAGFIASALAAEGDAYTWPTYRADLDYDTKTNIGVINAPTKFSTDCDGVTGQKAGKWWAFYWGNDRDSRITDETIDSLLKKYDTDFAYLRDTMGWAPDRRAQNGEYSAVYYYGSGTCAGGAKTDTTGGWQTNVGNRYYEAVAASFYPVYSFNPKCPYMDRVAQMDAMVHEGIHSMTKAYPGATNAHWFQEGGNTWIQQEMAARRNSNEKQHSGMGFLNAGAVIAPFIPVESYSGWLLDGSFGGPDAAGVGVFEGSQQLCNWRNLLGGYQYGNMFPTFLGEWVGKGAVRWIYGNAYGSTNYLLETFALSKGLGSAKTKQLIMEYRARLALLDMKKWSENVRTLLNDNFGGEAKAEWTPAASSPAAWVMTPYQTMTDSSGWLVPENRTVPGWSGANIVPLTVASGASKVQVYFKALGNNMSVQICYRATDGTPVYSEPVQVANANGTATAVLNLSKAPQSNVVFAVICNTDYQYTGNEDIRTRHYDYRLQAVSGISGAANPNTKWYNNFNLTYNWPELGDDYAPESSSSSVKSSSSSAKSSSSVASSSSAKPESSSSSKTPTSSSSIKSSSSSSNPIENPSSSSAVVDTLKYNVTIKLPIDDNYAAAKTTVDLGDMTGATFFAVEPNGTFNETSTANAPGHWFNDKGAVVKYTDDDATVYCEWNFATGEIAIGHYPTRVSDGDVYTFSQGIKQGNTVKLYSFSVTVTNEESSPEAEIEPAVVYGITGPARHLQLANNRGVLTLNYTLNRRDNVKVSLYSAFGAVLHQEFIGIQNAGTYSKTFDLARMDLPQGTYIVKVTTGSYREAQSITIVK